MTLYEAGQGAGLGRRECELAAVGGDTVRGWAGVWVGGGYIP